MQSEKAKKILQLNILDIGGFNELATFDLYIVVTRYYI